jgi:hypothetical protein
MDSGMMAADSKLVGLSRCLRAPNNWLGIITLHHNFGTDLYELSEHNNHANKTVLLGDLATPLPKVCFQRQH